MSPLERFERYARRIERINPQLNAYLDLSLEAARAEAEASAARCTKGAALSQVDGLCIAVKANIAVAGLPWHAGIAAYRDRIAEQDAEVVARLRAQGAVVLGTLNMHEGALGATTDNEAFGRCYNPWGQGLTPGGSSGGSGAAVAAGLCDIALGSDTMGSVRIPAAYCGVQGHKPTTRAVSIGGVVALSHTLDHVGPLAREVHLLAMALSAMSAGATEVEACQLAGLRIGVWDGAGAVELSPAVAAGFAKAQRLLEDARAELGPFSPPAYDYSHSRRAGLLISEVEAHREHEAALQRAPEGFSDAFRNLMQWGARQPAAKVEAAYAHVREVRAAAAGIWGEFDVVLAPTAPQEAFDFAFEAPASQADFTAWADFAALPATAVCSGLSDAGLPLSVQVIGPEGRDGQVLGVAAALERLFGQPPRPPGFW